MMGKIKNYFGLQKLFGWHVAWHHVRVDVRFRVQKLLGRY
jgi:hypothetical protein